VLHYKKSHYVIDTSGGGRGFGIYIKDAKLHYQVNWFLFSLKWCYSPSLFKRDRID